MKIYVQESTPLYLAKKIDKIIKINKSIEIKQQNIIKIYSKEGIYMINEDNSYRLVIKSEKLFKKSFDKINIIIDDSTMEKEVVYQIPMEHVSLPILVSTYSVNKYLNFVVENLLLNDNQENCNNRVINYYFECNKDNNTNDAILEHINVFLSRLN